MHTAALIEVDLRKYIVTEAGNIVINLMNV